VEHGCSSAVINTWASNHKPALSTHFLGCYWNFRLKTKPHLASIAVRDLDRVNESQNLSQVPWGSNKVVSRIGYRLDPDHLETEIHANVVKVRRRCQATLITGRVQIFLKMHHDQKRLIKSKHSGCEDARAWNGLEVSVSVKLDWRNQ